MTSTIEELLANYNSKSKTDYESAIHEIMQEIALDRAYGGSKFFENVAFMDDTSLTHLVWS